MQDLRYRVEIHENADRIVVGLLTSAGAARKVAEYHVDDALPFNTVHVYDKVTGKQIGHAFLDPEGDSEWKPVIKKE